ncbi:Cytochrome-c peroxidase [[Clostridium] ultunense Esp]|nr:Cytochrome-c peroxidase [[Clostridium] ultunense Esp]
MSEGKGKRGYRLLFFLISLVLIPLLLMAGCGTSGKKSAGAEKGNESLPTAEESLRAEYWMYQDLGPVPVAVMNPLSPEKIELGKKLFFDPRLSGDNSLSCASCHSPEHGFTDGRPTAVGIRNQTGPRNAPTLINATYYKKFHLDGSVNSLEEQVLKPIQNPIEMGQNLADLVKELKAVPGYVKEFNNVFQGEITPERIAMAIAAFERTIVQRDTPFDRFMAGDDHALTQEQKLGMELFANKGNCMVCHAGPTFSDNDYDNVGVDNGDLGRFLVTALEMDKGKFRTPQLRDLKYTAPYMHDGSMATLEEVIDHYDVAEHVNQYVSQDFVPLHLTKEEKKALVSFLRDGLSGPPLRIDPPVLP